MINPKIYDSKGVRRPFKPDTVDFSKVRPSKTVPDQTLSIAEIMKRFSRQIPIDLNVRKPVYVDQSEHDLERLARMDFADKHQFVQDSIAETEQVMEEARVRKKERDDERKSVEAKKAAQNAASGIGNLDNTMPDDTKLKNK